MGMGRTATARWGRLRRVLAASAAALAFGVAAGAAGADVASDAETRLTAFEKEAGRLGTGLSKPDGLRRKDVSKQRRLVDAQVAFATGQYDSAALGLFDYVAQSPAPADLDVGLYYLAEALYQKGDRVAARTYFTRVAREKPQSKYYQASVERLIDLAVILSDHTGVEEWITALDRIPAGQRRASAPYVRGKYAYATGKFEEALGYFDQVGKGSTYDFQARYYAATTHVAKGDTAKAIEIFEAILDGEARTGAQHRVVELTNLAIGRLYYERDQPSKSIDSYLQIDRRSDLFDDALYEVAWVYVKGKQFDKALRVLELLALSDPSSQKLPTVRMLEANLRIRKAQLLKQREMQGVANPRDGVPADEYTRAQTIFTEVHDAYVVPHDELTRAIDQSSDPGQFLTQITGRSSAMFPTTSTMPETAVAWIRDEPDVDRVVLVENDLGEIQSNIAETERSIERLENAMSAANRVGLFPELGKKATRAAEIQAQLAALMGQLLDDERKAVGSAPPDVLAAIDAAATTRRQAAATVAGLPAAARALEQQVTDERTGYDKVDQTASEVQVVVEGTESELAALKKYATDANPPLDTLRKLNIEQGVAELDPDLAGMRAELGEIRGETVLGRDEATAGDAIAAQAKSARAGLRAALAAETAAMARATGAGGDKARTLHRLVEKAALIDNQLEQTTTSIDGLVGDALVDIKKDVAQEKADLTALRQEFLSAEAEARALGGTVVGASFREVKAKFYDILVRSDVGVVDVAWSQKDDVDADLDLWNLQRTRELKQLRDEFRDLLEDKSLDLGAGITPPAGMQSGTPAPLDKVVAPAPAGATTPAPAPTPATGGNQ